MNLYLFPFFKTTYTLFFKARSFLTKHGITDNMKSYVGTDEISGQIQLELLKKEECIPTSKVLEIGCGSLHLGIPLISYLEKGNYVWEDPNPWLREKTIKKNEILLNQKKAVFSNVDDFDISMLGRKFDFVFSHSILSHCAYHQLEEFLAKSSKVLHDNGKILASIFLAEGNDFGSKGSKDKQDSMDKEWVYPFISWFKLSTVKEMAQKYNYSVEYIPEYTEYYTKTKPIECHDWLVFTKTSKLL